MNARRRGWAALAAASLATSLIACAVPADPSRPAPAVTAPHRPAPRPVRHRARRRSWASPKK